MLVCPKWPEAVEQALAKLQQELAVEKRGETLRNGELQRLLFDGESAVRERLHTQPKDHEPILKETCKQLYEAGYQPDAAESVLRFASSTLAQRYTRETSSCCTAQYIRKH